MKREDERNSNSVQTLKADAQLSTLLQEFSSRVQKRATKLIDAKAGLEQKLRNVDQAAERASFGFVAARSAKPLSFDISDDYDFDSCACEHEHEHEHEKINFTSKVNVKSNSDADLNCASRDNYDGNELLLMEEELKAKVDGLAALKFHSSSKSAHEYEYYAHASDHYFGIEEEDSESPQYYESADADIFNQRPLPFIIGSKDFRMAKDGGISIGSQPDTENNSLDHVS